MEKPGQVNQVSSTALEDSNNNKNGHCRGTELNGDKKDHHVGDIEVVVDEDDSMEDEDDDEEEELIRAELDDIEDDIEEIEDDEEEDMDEEEVLFEQKNPPKRNREDADEDIDVEN